MSDDLPSNQVAVDELLARFITVMDWVRADRTLRQDAFIPPKDLNLSVTRHTQLTEARLWEIGRAVAAAVARQKPSAGLYGKATLAVAQLLRHNLSAVAAPLPENPNHAHVTGWPSEKSAQKSLAQELAAAVGKIVPPPTH